MKLLSTRCALALLFTIVCNAGFAQLWVSSTPIDLQNPDATAHQTEFGPTDHIYAVAKLPAGDCEYAIYPYASAAGQREKLTSYPHAITTNDACYLVFDILPAPEHARTEGPEKVAEMLAGAKPGKAISITLEVVRSGKAVEKVKIKYTPAADTDLTANWKAAKPHMEAWQEQQQLAASTSTALEEKFTRNDGALKDPALNREYLKTLFSTDFEQCNGCTLLSLTVDTWRETDFVVVKDNATGLPMAMDSQSIWVVYKTTDGLCHYSGFALRKDHLGAGQYGEPYLYQGGFPIGNVECGAVE